MDAKLKIEQLKQQIKQAETAKTVAETQLAVAQKQEEEAIAALHAEGVVPETVGDEIAQLSSFIAQEIEAIETDLQKLKEAGVI